MKVLYLGSERGTFNASNFLFSDPQDFKPGFTHMQIGCGFLCIQFTLQGKCGRNMEKGRPHSKTTPPPNKARSTHQSETQVQMTADPPRTADGAQPQLQDHRSQSVPHTQQNNIWWSPDQLHPIQTATNCGPARTPHTCGGGAIKATNMLQYYLF